MNLLREILSTILFSVGVLLPFEIFSEGFDWFFVLGTIGCLLLAYYIWPSKKRGKRQEDHWLLDFLEVVIELPVELLLWFFRIFVRILKAKDGFDIDL